MLIMVWTSSIYHATIHMLIPRTATLGAAQNPDVAIGAVCATFTFFITSYMVRLNVWVTFGHSLMLIPSPGSPDAAPAAAEAPGVRIDGNFSHLPPHFGEQWTRISLQR